MQDQSRPIDIVKVQLTAWREQLLNNLLPITVALATIGIAVWLIFILEPDKRGYLPIYVGLYLVLLAVTFIRRPAYRIRATIVLLLIAAMGIVVLLETGLSGEGRSFLVILPVAAMVLLGWRESLISLGLSIAVFLLFGWLISSDLIRIPDVSEVDPNRFTFWVLAATIASMLATGVIIALRAILQNLISTLDKEQKARQQLHEVSDFLEKKVETRTKQLEHKSAELATISRINRSLSTITDPDELLHQAANLILENVGLSHAAVYWLDQDKPTGVLLAAAGQPDQAEEPGQATAARDRSLVDWCLTHGQARIEQKELSSEAGAPPNEISRMVLPLRAGRHLIGALEVHRQSPAAFNNDDLATLQSIADQVAMMVENTHLSQQAQTALNQLEVANRLLVKQAWHEYTSSGRAVFAEYHQTGQAGWSPAEVEPLIENDSPPDQPTISVPITLHGEELGHLVVEMLTDDQPQLDDVRQTLQEVAIQTAAALESARQFEDSQQRFNREQLLSEVAARISSSLDPDTIIKTTVRELATALGARQTFVEITGRSSESGGP